MSLNNTSQTLFIYRCFKVSACEGLCHCVCFQITAVDTDVGSNGELTYSVVIDNQGQYFNVRSIDGMEDGTELYSLEEFDRELPPPGGVTIDGDLKYKVTVTATDNGRPSLSTNCFFFVTIADINDKAPNFDDQNNIGTIPDNTANGQRALRVFAIDMDQLDTDNSAVVYSIVSQDQGCLDCFTMEPETGWILVNTAGFPDDVSNTKDPAS